MFLKRLFAQSLSQGPKRSSAVPAPPDDWLRQLRLCLAREGGIRATAVRAEMLAIAFREASPQDRARFATLLRQIDDAGPEALAERYTRMEEAELFGRRWSRIAMFDAFETPRRRLLALLAATAAGPAMLEDLKATADAELAADIAEVLAAL